MAYETEPYDPICLGCNAIIDEGNVVAFGDGLWHVYCFRCAKCHNLVEHDKNLLLLSDGNPLCENCSYNCHVCKKPISDEAIMTGQEAFHVECFRCRHCRRRIEDLVFAKTSQGIYCMDCHNEKLNRPRRSKEKDNNSLNFLYEKSLPSLPTEEKNKERRKLKPQRSFDSQSSQSSQRHVTPKRSTESLNRYQNVAQQPAPNSSRRKSRTLDTQAVSDSLRKFSDSDAERKRSDSLSSSSSSSYLQAPSLQVQPLNKSASSLSLNRTGTPSPTPLSRNSLFVQPSSFLRDRDVNKRTGLSLRRNASAEVLSIDVNASERIDKRDGRKKRTKEKERERERGRERGRDEEREREREREKRREREREKEKEIREREMREREIREREREIREREIREREIREKEIREREIRERELREREIRERERREKERALELEREKARALELEREKARALELEREKARALELEREREREREKEREQEKVVDAENFRARNDSITTIQSDTRSVRSFSISSYRSDVTESTSDKLVLSPTVRSSSLPSQSASSPAPHSQSTSPKPPQTLTNSNEEQQTTSPSPTYSYPRSPTPPSPQSGSLTTPQSPSSEAHTFKNGKTATDINGKNEIKDTDDADDVNDADDADGADDASETSDATQESEEQVTFSPRPNIDLPVLPPLSFSLEDDLINIIENTRFSRQNSMRKSKTFAADDADLLSGLEGKSVDLLGLGEEAEAENVLSREHERKDIPRVTIECEEESVTALKAELIETKKKLVDVENKYHRIKRISQEALTITHNSYTEERVYRHEAEMIIEELQAKLAARNKKIAELKQENDAKDRMIKDSQALKLELEEMRNTLKDLNMQKELLLKEIEGLTKEKEDGSTNNPSSLVRHISTHLDEVKQAYMSDIRSLQNDSESLRKETENLRILRDQCIEEARALNEKNLELADLNNELMQQIEAHQKTSKGGFGFFRTKPSVPDKDMYISEHARTSSVATLDSTISNDGSNSTYKDSTQVMVVQRGIAHKNSINRGETPKKFKWKKGGVLNKLLYSSNDENKRVSPNISPTSTLTGNEEVGKRGEKERERERERVSSESERRRLPGDSGQAKAHTWQQTTFYRLVKCEHCSEKIWGINVDVRCSACGVGCHQKCASSCTSACTGSPGAYADEAESIASITATIFGIELHKQLESEGRDIPLLVEKCIKAVEARGMDFEGIYRKSGGMSQMKAIITAFEQGEDIDLNSPTEFNDIGAVTSVLRQFFRELPDPLFTTGLYNKFLEASASKTTEDKLDRFRQAIAKLPKGHYSTARYLMNHLYRVRQAGSENLMSAKSLSVVFGPTILKGPDPNAEMIDMKLRNSAVEFMIENAPELWIKDIVVRKDGFL